MPTNPSPIHSHGTLPTFRAKDGRWVYIAWGCIVHQNGRGHETLAGSSESAAWLLANVAPSAERDLQAERLRVLAPKPVLDKRKYEPRRKA